MKYLVFSFALTSSCYVLFDPEPIDLTGTSTACVTTSDCIAISADNPCDQCSYVAIANDTIGKAKLQESIDAFATYCIDVDCLDPNTVACVDGECRVVTLAEWQQNERL
jgi:hypothetical protein